MVDELRVAIAGSVDDGKSTLIGRLLLDTKALFDDQTARIKASGMNSGYDLAAVTDGLKEEREQGITIDVAYRYFATPKRRFVLIDTPGHELYTRNMVTGASNASASIIIVDAVEGLKRQTHRHSLIAKLLGHKNIIFAINKLDLVYEKEYRYLEIKEECFKLAQKLKISSFSSVPISALYGNGVVLNSSNFSWYDGPSLLEQLENIRSAQNFSFGSRIPVQWVNRIHNDTGDIVRGLTGTFSGKVVSIGDKIKVFPENVEAHIKELWVGGKSVSMVEHGQDAQVFLEEDLDVSRGDVLSFGTPPSVEDRMCGIMCWFSAIDAKIGQVVHVLQGGAIIKSRITAFHETMDPSNLCELETTGGVSMNQIVRTELEFSKPAVLDDFSQHQSTGAAILVNPLTAETLGAIIWSKFTVSDESITSAG